jgi:hypothetical protein
MFVDCMPMVPPDPVGGSFVARYDNTKGSTPAGAWVLAAKVHFGPTEILKFPVTPDSSGPVGAGAVIEVKHTKQKGDPTPGLLPCQHCNGVWQLEVIWNVGGKQVSEMTAPAPVQCAY